MTIINLTGGNVRNGHIYLRIAHTLFPDDVIGGSNKNRRALKNLTLYFDGLANPISTDIAGDKMIFRDRASCGEFFRIHRLQAGDQVAIDRIAKYKFRVRPVKKVVNLRR
jgi:hypothetical protein